jgi:hypothetical protein
MGGRCKGGFGAGTDDDTGSPEVQSDSCEGLEF